MKTLLAVTLLAAGVAHAGNVTYDPNAAALQERYAVEYVKAYGCMYATGSNSLRMGERNAAVIVANLADVCGGPMRAFLVGEAGATKAEAWGYTVDMSRAVLKTVPGVAGVR